MHHDRAGHQKSVDQIELPLEDRGEAPGAERSGEAASAGRAGERSGLGTSRLMERGIGGGKLRRALKRVEQNEGSAGAVRGWRAWGWSNGLPTGATAGR